MGRKRGTRGFKKMTGWQKAGSAIVVATQALSLAKNLKHLINVEKKFIDITSGGTVLPVNTTGTVVPLNNVGQGVNLTDRIGDSIKMTSVMLEGFVQMNPLSTVGDYILVSLIIDRQSNAVVATFNDIYELGTGTASLAQRNKLSVDRFKVIKTWSIPLVQAGEQLKKFKAYLKMDEHVKWNQTVSGIPYSNALYLVFAGNLSANFSNINYFSRVRYVDN